MSPPQIVTTPQVYGLNLVDDLQAPSFKEFGTGLGPGTSNDDFSGTCTITNVAARAAQSQEKTETGLGQPMDEEELHEETVSDSMEINRLPQPSLMIETQLHERGTKSTGGIGPLFQRSRHDSLDPELESPPILGSFRMIHRDLYPTSSENSCELSRNTTPNTAEFRYISRHDVSPSPPLDHTSLPIREIKRKRSHHDVAVDDNGQFKRTLPMLPNFNALRISPVNAQDEESNYAIQFAIDSMRETKILLAEQAAQLAQIDRLGLKSSRFDNPSDKQRTQLKRQTIGLYKLLVEKASLYEEFRQVERILKEEDDDRVMLSRIDRLYATKDKLLKPVVGSKEGEKSALDNQTTEDSGRGLARNSEEIEDLTNLMVEYEALEMEIEHAENMMRETEGYEG